MNYLDIHIGIDDEDREIGGCTTHFATLLIVKFLGRFKSLKFIDYPNLVRLNPAIPWKTRGNGAVSIHIKVPENILDKVIDEIIAMHEEYSEAFRLGHGKEPGIVIVKGDIPSELTWLYRKAVSDVVALSIARKIAHDINAEVLVDGRGIVGALAAIGWFALEDDCTYELLLYRSRDMWGYERRVDSRSIRSIETNYQDIFSSYDYEEKRVIVTPRGPDPVLLGLRGENPETLLRAMNDLIIHEPISFWCIFRTNQGTNAHSYPRRISNLRPYQTCIVRGVVHSNPRIERGGHVVFHIRQESEVLRVITYKPSGLTSIARKLVPGDIVSVLGAIKMWSDGVLTLNAEELILERAVELYRAIAPRCPRCGGSMESLGKGKGFRCRKCKYRDPDAKKQLVRVRRDIDAGIYLGPPSSHKHLLKPYRRFGKENICRIKEPTGQWIGPLRISQ
mgnify:CR=1 FL=1